MKKRETMILAAALALAPGLLLAAVWDRANRLGGRLFFLCGLGMLVAAPLLPESLLAAMAILMALAAAVAPCIMSLVWWKRKQARGPDGCDKN